MVGVIQRTHDVDFSFSIPYLTLGLEPLRNALRILSCRIVYHPADDSCVLFNTSARRVLVQDLQEQQQQEIRPTHFVVLRPGYWRLSVAVENGNKEGLQRLADILLVQRRFHVSLQDIQQRSEAGKRNLCNPSSRSFQKRVRIEQDETQVIFQQLGSVSKRSQSLALSKLDARVAVLDLEDGQTALIQSTVKARMRTKEEQTLAPYQLTRINGIAKNSSTNVFTCSHSGIDAPDVVAKVLRYGGSDEGNQLASCANSWIREKQLLEKFKHPNLVSMYGFDGRQFAIFLESLPRRLFRGINCKLRPGDNLTILRDISSVLAYLAMNGACHNDVKPDNIAFSPQRGAVLLDLGLATERADQTQAGGTPWYVPREFYETGRTSPAGDVWALGVTLLYTLGMITFPDLRENLWQLGKAKRKTEPDYGKMSRWLGYVGDVRETCLDRSDLVQSLVYDMLDSNRQCRITAASICFRLRRVTP